MIECASRSRAHPFRQLLIAFLITAKFYMHSKRDSDCDRQPHADCVRVLIKKLKSWKVTRLQLMQATASLHWNLPVGVAGSAAALIESHRCGFGWIFLLHREPCDVCVASLTTSQFAPTQRCNFIQFKWIAIETIVALCQFLRDDLQQMPRHSFAFDEMVPARELFHYRNNWMAPTRMHSSWWGDTRAH